MEEVKLHLKKAHQKLQATEVLLNNGLYADAVSRAYYAMFHATKAVLLLKGVKPKTHVGVIKEFGLEFVSEGYVDELLGKSFSAARENREF
ncbi:MAG: HEPN domain-containing protein, partial [Candidatus Hydrothermarchaeota archaeon]|nr:HEPN domain-containing protein [Candidatus Hydrothermarchaeota archaeon]